MAARSSASLTRWRRQAIHRMATSREATLRLIARLPEDAIMRPRTLDRWSVKDMLVHFLTCDEETLRRFRLIAGGRADRIAWFDMAHANRFNARSVAQGRRLSLPTVLRRMARVRAAMIQAFERLPIEALRDPSHAYTVVSWLTAPGWSHEREHLAQIHSWWRQTRRPRGASPPRRRPR
jgi:hypothetical protein